MGPGDEAQVGREARSLKAFAHWPRGAGAARTVPSPSESVQPVACQGKPRHGARLPASQSSGLTFMGWIAGTRTARGWLAPTRALMRSMVAPKTVVSRRRKRSLDSDSRDFASLR